MGGWEIGGIAVLQAGLPYTVTVSGSPSNTGAGSRANPVPGADPNPANRSIDLWFNPAAFTTPPAFTWGTLGRNSLTGPALANFDFSIAKKDPILGKREPQFRTEFFNGLNHPQFGSPNATIGVEELARSRARNDPTGKCSSRFDWRSDIGRSKYSKTYRIENLP